jgi:hypothetical protein
VGPLPLATGVERLAVWPRAGRWKNRRRGRPDRGRRHGDGHRATVGSWLPLDLANVRLHRALLASAAQARPELGITPAVVGLKTADDLTGSVDRLVGTGEAFGTINAALYILLLRRLPDAAELPMINSRHPRHALIAIRSGDQYRKQGRRTVAG